MIEDKRDPEGRQKGGDTFTSNISHVSDSQIAIGRGILQQNLTARGLAYAEAQALLQMLASLREQVEKQAPQRQREEALKQVDALAQAVTANKPDLTAMQKVKEWFVAHLPALAGAVTSVVVHPIVGKLVETAGDALAHEFKRRFGG